MKNKKNYFKGLQIIQAKLEVSLELDLVVVEEEGICLRDNI